ncbi:hypothetical protein GUITHDRAFT_136956 [Guillardia theta CCMP2712]|uniref:Uncharacterized protein n=1 Tax=Guillardia theta (strain CCMP2712) TaxID=905079 RepID=L1JHL6_GUITC|nr:hypothetical protein GUITHDRAFT_136956 [Guillardia theta CCMP2712]EKX47991.1 hypothetical protein GUITHDRAFT_136956 [Guillardia theta CCMP2712]|eukprot:XP_005834971.1 hypothetical protein GUITHDRAFT_136956 [Guillardia theta CCMP2712]
MLDDFLEGGLSMLRHKPKTQQEKEKEEAKSISNGSSGWLKFPLVDLSPVHETVSGQAASTEKSDAQIVTQTCADCAVLATPGLVGCIAAADSIATGKSLAEGLTDPFRINPKPRESPYKTGW